MDQLRVWQGQFGQDYTDRNQVDPESRRQGFASLLGDLDLSTVLEVGCNRGHNLVALRDLGYQVSGIEPMRYAREQAIKDGLTVRDGSAYDIPFPDRWVDLVFTSGVLIHVPPARLLEALGELTRVARRYLLVVEYHSPGEQEVRYQGRDGMLWRRDYTSLLDDLHGFTVIESGVAPDGFDGATFTIAERSG